MDVVGKVACVALGIALCILGEGSGVTQSAAQPSGSAVANPLQRPLDIAFIQTPEFRAGDPGGRFPLGSRLVRLRLGAGGTAPSVVTPLTPQFFAAADPQVSFDGGKLVFAGQTQRNAAWQIWEMPVEGGTPRQVTHCTGDCVQPVYLPEGEIAYTSLRGGDSARASEVQVCRNDGSGAHPITFGPGRYEVEAVLRSGRLLLSAVSPLVDTPGVNQQRSLYLVDPDGSGLMLLRQADTARTIRSGAVELADGTILFMQRDAAGASEEQLAWIRRGGLRATPIEHASSGYASANALDDGTLLSSRRVAGHRFDLYQRSLDRGGQRAVALPGCARVERSGRWYRFTPRGACVPQHSASGSQIRAHHLPRCLFLQRFCERPLARSDRARAGTAQIAGRREDSGRSPGRTGRIVLRNSARGPANTPAVDWLAR